MEGKRNLSDVINMLTLCCVYNKETGVRGKVVSALHFTAVIVLVVGFSMTTASLYLSGIKESLARYAFFWTTGLMLGTHGIFFWFHRPQVKETVQLMKHVVEKREKPKHVESFKKLSIKVWLGLKLLLCICLGFSVIYYIIPLIFDTYMAMFTNSTEPFTMPIPMGVLGTEEPSRSISYYCLILFMIGWTLVVGLFSTAYYTLLYIHIFYICHELNIISENILHWGEIYQNNGHNKQTVDGLKKIVQDHQEILKLTSKVREIIGIPFLTFNIVAPVAMTLLLYTVSREMNRNVVLMAINLFLLICMGGFLFTSCLAGEILQSRSLKVFESFCDIHWYEMTPKIRKDLNLIILVAIRPITIHYKGKGCITLETFMQIVNACYSYFMLLNSMN